MKNGVGVPQSIVLFGGTSEIGLAIVERLLRPGVTRLALVSRDVSAAEQAVAARGFARPGLDIVHVPFDAGNVATMPQVTASVVDAVGDIDIAVVAHGVLKEGHDYYADPAAVAEVVQVNFTGAMALLYGLADRMRSQGYGKIVLLSSVAGERVRRGNPAYGATKAGIDGFALALDHELSGSGASVLLVRPGFVETKMTAGMKKAPMSTTADAVADITVKAIGSDKTVVWAPGVLRFVFAVFKILPLAIWRKLPI
jgi:decaprenylphospho-beta-D-erythro-pentofuranosid-2-ulose 2-reductase